MKYKHIKELGYNEWNIIFNLRDDILEQAIVNLANNNKNEQINHSKIKKEFMNILLKKDLVIDTENFTIYEKIN